MKNSKPFYVVLALLCIPFVLLKGQNQKITASKNYITKEIPVSGTFEKISIQGFVDVEYRQGGTQGAKISVYGSDNLVDLVEVKVTGGELLVSFKKNTSVQGQTRLKVIASSPSLNMVTINGSADVDLKGALKGEIMQLLVSGSGDIQADNLSFPTINAEVKGSGDITLKQIKCKSFTSHVQGSGDIKVKGTANTATLTVNGSGDIDAKELIADVVDARISGSGDIDCFAKKELQAKASGSGDIKYRGKPANVTKDGKKENITAK